MCESGMSGARGGSSAASVLVSSSSLPAGCLGRRGLSSRSAPLTLTCGALGLSRSGGLPWPRAVLFTCPLGVGLGAAQRLGLCLLPSLWPRVWGGHTSTA